MTLASNGSSVYLIFVLINSLAFPPVTGTEDTNHTSAIGNADSQNATLDLTETEIALLVLTVSKVFRDHTMRVGESVLSQGERYPMLKLVFSIFVGIPFKLYLFHWVSLTRDSGLRHMNIWRMIWLTLLRVHSRRNGELEQRTLPRSLMWMPRRTTDEKGLAHPTDKSFWARREPAGRPVSGVQVAGRRRPSSWSPHAPGGASLGSPSRPPGGSNRT